MVEVRRWSMAATLSIDRTLTIDPVPAGWRRPDGAGRMVPAGWCRPDGAGWV